MDLIDHWVVGFTGKRKLGDPERVRSALHTILQDTQTLADGRFVVMSSAAIGSDLLFATEATALGIPWICVLPFPEEAFFNDEDFPDPQERMAARQKAREAADCEVVGIPRNSEELNDKTWRRTAFADAGFKCVDEADIVIAVLPEGATGKPGGTADVVAHARLGERPLVIIDPETLQVRRENWPARLQDPLTERLRRLPSGSLTEKERKILPVTTDAALRVAEWRGGFARAARKHIPSIRWGTSAVVILHALATLFTASVFLLLWPVNFSALERDSPQPADGGLLVQVMEKSAFAFVLTGFIFLAWMLWKQPQVNAASYRLAAEIGRSILATWCIPEAASDIIRGLPREFSHLARNLLLNERLDPDRPHASSGISPDNIRKLAADYLCQRIVPQIEYYSEKCKRSKRVAHALEFGSIILSFTAVVSAGFLAFAHGAEFHRALWGLAKLAAATGAPVAVSMLVIHEVKRREARYHEMAVSLQRYHERISQVRSASALRELVANAERMLLGECHEWWILAKSNVAA